MKGVSWVVGIGVVAWRGVGAVLIGGVVGGSFKGGWVLWRQALCHCCGLEEWRVRHSRECESMCTLQLQLRDSCCLTVAACRCKGASEGMGAVLSLRIHPLTMSICQTTAFPHHV